MSGLPRSPATVENRISVSVRAPGWNTAALRVRADVAGDLEVAERAAALGVRLAFGDPLPVELRHLLDQVVIVQQDRPVPAHGQRVLIALNQDAGVVGGCGPLGLGHGSPLLQTGRREPSAHRRTVLDRLTALPGPRYVNPAVTPGVGSSRLNTPRGYQRWSAQIFAGSQFCIRQAQAAWPLCDTTGGG